MLTRIQIRAEGNTAREVEGELRWAAARLIQDFGLTGELTEQVIEGTPDKSFSGRLSIIVKEQPTGDAMHIEGLKRTWVEEVRS